MQLEVAWYKTLITQKSMQLLYDVCDDSFEKYYITHFVRTFSSIIKNAKCYKCYFLASETQKTHFIKTCICYKICNLATVHSHFWERIVARLYNILLFSNSLSPQTLKLSLSFFGSPSQPRHHLPSLFIMLLSFWNSSALY